MTSKCQDQAKMSESGLETLWEEVEFFDWSFLLVLSGIVWFALYNIKTNAIKAIQQCHSLTHQVKFLSPAHVPS